MLFDEDDWINDTHPKVSIILPTYNRAHFLPGAFASILAQDWEDWELIVVDDGSTDDTRDVVSCLSRNVLQVIRYVRQENRGAYAARNRGVELARGSYIAFFDSDDRWLPHHLRVCSGALDASPEVDWVYGAARRIDLETGRVLTPNTFYIDGHPRPFLSLKANRSGPLRIIDDPDALTYSIRHGLYCGLQASLIRRDLLVNSPLRTEPRNESEDQVYVVRAMALGVRFGYIDDVLLDYYVHGANSSASASRISLEQHARVYRELIQGYEVLYREIRIPWRSRMALRRRLGEEWFWCLGYSILWGGGCPDEAFQAFRMGIAWWPWELRFWKSWAIASLRRGPRENLSTIAQSDRGVAGFDRSQILQEAVGLGEGRSPAVAPIEGP